MIPVIGGIVSGVVGLARDWVSGKREEQQLKKELKKKTLEKETEMVLQGQQLESAWELATTKKSSGFVIWSITFFLLFPYFWAVYDAEAVKKWFTVISNFPSYYIEITLMMLLTAAGRKSFAKGGRTLLETIKRKK